MPAPIQHRESAALIRVFQGTTAPISRQNCPCLVRCLAGIGPPSPYSRCIQTHESGPYSQSQIYYGWTLGFEGFGRKRFERHALLNHLMLMVILKVWEINICRPAWFLFYGFALSQAGTVLVFASAPASSWPSTGGRDPAGAVLGGVVTPVTAAG